jgi:hypothetical protein
LQSSNESCYIGVTVGALFSQGFEDGLYNGSKDSDKRRSSMKVEASKHGTTEETLFTGI